MMAYRNNFAVAIKHNGKILRESNDVVSLPFGSEYSVYMKNKNSRRAVVKVEIDGVDVIDGNSIIVEPNSSLELKGFMKGSVVKNRFRFIEKTDRIQRYRGNRIDDGLVRIEYWFEKPPHNIVYHNPVKFKSRTSTDSVPTYWGLNHNTTSTNITYGASMGNCFCPDDEEGITVKGSRTRQDFTYGSVGELENYSTVIILKLRGRNKTIKSPTSKGKIVRKPITVKTKLQCEICGIRSKSSARYCRHCGTYLN